MVESGYCLNYSQRVQIKIVPILIIRNILGAAALSNRERQYQIIQPWTEDGGQVNLSRFAERRRGAAFAQASYRRVDADERMPAVGREAVIALVSRHPTATFAQNKGLVVQFNIPRYPTPLEAKLAAYQLVAAAVSAAREHNITLAGVEVLYFHQSAMRFSRPAVLSNEKDTPT